MARLVLLLTLLAGCNSVLGNDRAITRDARYFDAPFDAPFTCRPAGQPPPELDPGLHEVFVQDCVDYSFQGGRATAWCMHSHGAREVFEGPREGPLVVVAELLESSLVAFHDQPRLSSDASRMYFRRTDFTIGNDVRVFARQAGDTFEPAGVAAFGANTNDSLSTFARGPTGDHVIVRAADAVLHEWAEAGGTWHETQVHSGVGVMFNQVKLSPDGLHLVGHTANGIFYTDRATVDAPFRAAEPYPSAPLDVAAPLMTEDCARVYVAGVGEVFYAQQR